MVFPPPVLLDPKLCSLAKVRSGWSEYLPSRVVFKVACWKVQTETPSHPNMMRRERLLCVISVSAAATISDGSSGACSAVAAFVPPPTYGPSVPQRTVHPCSQPNRTCRIRRLHQTSLRDKLSASDESIADDGRGPTSPASSLFQSILLDQSIEDISDRISSRIVLPFYVPQPIISAATTLAVQQLTTECAISGLIGADR